MAGLRRWIVTVLVGALVGAGVYAYLNYLKAPSEFEVSAPAAGEGAQVAQDGWKVRLNGRHSGGTLTMRRGDRDGATWDGSLRELEDTDGLEVGAPVEVTLEGSRLGREGAKLTRRLDDPLPEGAHAALTYYDAEADAWRPVPTRVSPDRRTLTAQVRHFSFWSFIEYGAGWLLDKRVDAPDCHGEVPDWVDDVEYLDDRNAPLRWCAGQDEKRPELLVLKLAVNRSYGVGVRAATEPEWVYNKLFSYGPEDTMGRMVGRLVENPGEHPVMGGEEIHFGFTEAQVRALGPRPLIRVSPELNYALAGFTYSAIVEMGELADELKHRRIAAAVALVAIAQCEAAVGEEVARRKWSAVIRNVIACVEDNADDLAVAAAAPLAGAFPKEDPRKLGRLIGKAVARAGIALAGFKVAVWFADRKLEKAAFVATAFPKIRRTRPEPEVTPEPVETEAPEVETEPEPEGFEPGASFESDCVVAWPTAPTHTSRGIQMMMSCSGVPSRRFLLTQVVYDNPDFTITPSTGRVHVIGEVRDVARSEYGYTTLIVQASDIVK